MKENGNPAATETLEVKVADMSFLLERLGHDCAPDQFVRELTVNAIQAVQAGPAAGGRVVWDHDPVLSERLGARKLAITDTGTGMTGPEMVRYINHLAASGHERSADGNFGVGAKIAAAPRNPAGMVYLSWKNGRGAMIWLWKDPRTGRYGLRPLPRPDGTLGPWAPVPASMKPAGIGAHGTMVVLLGKEDRDETVAPPDGVVDDASAGSWLVRYLNARFFAFPPGIEVYAREGWRGRDTRLRRVTGMRDLLGTVAEAAGCVALGNAVARWWILPEAGIPDELAARHPAGGHVGALFGNELYEVYTGRSGAAKLQSFGIAVGHHRVVLYVEPDSEGARRVVANTARTALLLDGRPLPWGDWAEVFRRRLPPEIVALMEDVAGRSDARDRTRSFKDRMKGLANLLFIGGAAEDNLLRLFAPDRAGRRTRTAGARVDRGPAAVAPDTAEAARAAGSESAERASTAAPPDPTRGDPSRAANDGAVAPPASRGNAKPIALDLDRLLDLEVAWVSEAECGAYDRAAHYIPETNTLLMNRDFRVFAEYVQRWREKYAGNPAAQREVEDLVREWLEQPLRELVIRSHFLRGSEGWSDDSIRVLLSDEALTAVSLPCYLTEMRLRTAVAQRLGKLPPDRAA
ncbi:MAG TPA: hypothetical protein VF188_02250 [Longimicrobiales bacterium]